MIVVWVLVCFSFNNAKWAQVHMDLFFSIVALKGHEKIPTKWSHDCLIDGMTESSFLILDLEIDLELNDNYNRSRSRLLVLQSKSKNR